jgi:hypothetical protein
MVNCCIHRRLQNAPQNGNLEDLDNMMKPKRNVGNLFDSVSADHEQRQTKFHSLLEKFVDGGGNSNKSTTTTKKVAIDVCGYGLTTAELHFNISM